MLVAFWSAIAFFIGLILLWLSFVNYQKHKELKEQRSATANFNLDSAILGGQRRVSIWRTRPRGASQQELVAIEERQDEGREVGAQGVEYRKPGRISTFDNARDDLDANGT